MKRSWPYKELLIASNTRSTKQNSVYPHSPCSLCNGWYCESTCSLIWITNRTMSNHFIFRHFQRNCRRSSLSFESACENIWLLLSLRFKMPSTSDRSEIDSSRNGYYVYRKNVRSITEQTSLWTLPFKHELNSNLKKCMSYTFRQCRDNRLVPLNFKSNSSE